ncbi:MAG TPA: RtcB family protein, partial [Mycobacteriales bacterium]
MAATVTGQPLVEDGPFRYRIAPSGDMRVPGIVYASAELLPEPDDRSLDQVVNVATLPGIVTASYAMPDLHWGYGFPIGGVAGTDVAAGGVVSPGGVGFDISCGVRLLAAHTDRAALAPALGRLMDLLGRSIPRGAGRGAVWALSDRAELERVLLGGSRYCVEHGLGQPRDLSRCEDGGAVADADPAAVSARAFDRGLGQVGSLGSGNHFLEVQVVTEVHDPAVASAFGVELGQVCVMIHCGSRGLGHQICTDHVRVMGAAMSRYGITVPDPQLACAPVNSTEGRAYLGAMAAAANYARANRQLLGEAVRRAFGQAAGVELDLVYDVSHNLAKLEEHPTDPADPTDGGSRLLCVHRKGATRALPPGHPELPADLSEAG